MLGVGSVVLGLVILLFWLPGGNNTGTTQVGWKLQPDSLPLGTVLQGSRTEISLGMLSDLKAPSPPGWVGNVPQFAEKPILRALHFKESMRAKRSLRIKVEVPGFLRLDRAAVEYHSTHGAFPVVELRLAADTPGDFEGVVTIRLAGREWGTATLNVPARVTVVATPVRWRVLMTQTPFDRYSTEHGSDFEALAGITSRLAAQGIQIDFLRQLPASLAKWNVVLLGEDAMAGLTGRSMTRLNQFLSAGGRLILTADAFYGDTDLKANQFMAPHGLMMDTKDAGGNLQTTNLVPDRFTAGISLLGFFRPARIWVTDPDRARLLAMFEADQNSGFLAVSRAPGRGEIVVLSQSLWWMWIQSDAGRGGIENARLLENLLAGPLEETATDPKEARQRRSP
jgi:hypothetical protein